MINDLNAIPFKAGKYYPYFSDVGEVTVSITHNMFKRSITINVKAGEPYYVKAGTKMILGTPYIKSVPAKRGLSEIAKCRRLPDVPGVY